MSDDNFELEINTIASGDYLNDKLLVFTAYYSIYKNLEDLLGDYPCSKSEKIEYLQFVRSSFHLCSDSFKTKGISYQEFLEQFLYLLRIHPLSDSEGIKKLIDYLNSHLVDLAHNMRFLNSIDDCSWPFYDKCNLSMLIIEYLNKVFPIFDDFYKDKAYYLKADILNRLNSNISFIISMNDDVSDCMKDIKSFVNGIVRDYINNGNHNSLANDNDNFIIGMIRNFKEGIKYPPKKKGISILKKAKKK